MTTFSIGIVACEDRTITETMFGTEPVELVVYDEHGNVEERRQLR